MENRSHALVAVIFLLVFFFGAVVAAWWMQSSGRAETKTYRIISAYGVSGLKVHAKVHFKGLEVGTVGRVALYDKNPQKVLIEIDVALKTPVTQKTYAQITSNGITGNSAVSLHDQHIDAPRLQTSDDNPARIPLQRSLVQRLKNDGQQMLTHANKVTERALRLLRPENRKHIDNILAQLDTATERLVGLEKRIQPLLVELPPLVDSAREVIAQSGRLMKTSRGDARRLRELLEVSNELVESLNRQTVPQIDALGAQLQKTAVQVSDTAQSLESNPGEIITGGPKSRPGPGEPGYRPPR